MRPPWIKGYYSNINTGPKRTINALNLKKKSARYNTSAALIYAASSINVGNVSLLDFLCSGRISFKNHGHHLHNWIGRSVYAGNEIIGPMYPRDSLKQQIDFLPDMKGIEIDVPDYRANHTIIDSEYMN